MPEVQKRTGQHSRGRRLALLGAFSILWISCSFSLPLNAEVSRCVAVARLAPHVVPVRLVRTVISADQVRIAYVGHATFRIESASGVTVATDYSGFAGVGPAPDIVTMNHAHTTHYTDFIDPEIKHVLRGWNPRGGPARHHLKVADVIIRNVPTDIRMWSGGREKAGNSIFIFEIAGLCIGHLGHLHHELGPEDIGVIGQLDVIMAPVDGSFTLDHESMVRTLKALKARLIIPMHAFGPFTLANFVQRMGDEFDVREIDTPIVTLSVIDLPAKPTILVMPESGPMPSFE
jgi:L-ascorbate metabolism protein UlaG (beta-lactamase superfamily)